MTTTETQEYATTYELHGNIEADRTIETVLTRLGERLDLGSAAERLRQYKPDDDNSLACLEAEVRYEGFPESFRPHFYKQRPFDRQGGVAQSATERLHSPQDYPSASDLLLDKREDTHELAHAFKVRGAMFAVLDILKDKPHVRVFTTGSAGNHAQGLVNAVKVLNESLISSGSVRTDEAGQVVAEDRDKLFEAHIYCRRAISAPKYDNLVANGATVKNYWDTLEDAIDQAVADADARHDAAMVHAFDDESVIAGQATVGLELLFDLKAQGVDLQEDAITVRIPVGGGGLFAGIAAVWQWAKDEGLLNRNARLIAAEMELCDSAARELSGRPPLGATIDTDPDGLATQKAGRNTLPIIESHSSGGVTVVPKKYMVLAADMLADAHGKPPEFAAVMSLACTLFDAETNAFSEQLYGLSMPGKKVDVTLSTGSNVAPEILWKNAADFADDPDKRVVVAAANLGHRGSVLAFQQMSRRLIQEADAELYASDPSEGAGEQLQTSLPRRTYVAAGNTVLRQEVAVIHIADEDDTEPEVPYPATYRRTSIASGQVLR